MVDPRLMKYLEARAKMLSERIKKPTCVNRGEQEARLAEVNAILNQVVILSMTKSET